MCRTYLLGAALILSCPWALARDHVPDMGEELVNTFCGDDSFLACADVDGNECRSALSEAARECDYSEVWLAITSEEYQEAQQHAKRYGECLVNKLKESSILQDQGSYHCLSNKLFQNIPK